jgi:hypothetical protein
MRFRLFKQLIFVVSAVPAFGGTINLASASAFGLLGGTISNTGTSVVHAEVGGTIGVTGFQPTGPGFATGGVFTGGAVAGPYTDFETAFDFANSQVSGATVGPGLTTQTFLGSVGVYAFSGTDVTSTAGAILTFDGQSNSNAVFIMQIAGTLTIDGPITFDLINGATANNIYWIVGTKTTDKAATIDPTGVPLTWDGNILAGDFTMSASTGGSGVLAGTINGCVLVVNANTLAGQTVVNGCSANSSSVPEPGSAAMLSLGCLAVALGLKYRSTR